MNEQPAVSTFAYDRVAYPGFFFPQNTPDRLAGAAMVHGFDAPDPETATWLDIGGGDCMTAIAAAVAYPKLRSVGFDLAPAAIERGRQIASALGLGNVDLHVGDITTYPHDGEAFDYIVSHGVYAWVPHFVRPALMSLIAARLKPGGIALVSFDAMPATAAKVAVGRYLKRRLNLSAPADDVAAEAARLVEVLRRNQRDGSWLIEHLDLMIRTKPWQKAAYFFHDDLAEFHDPVSMRDFVRDARAGGLNVAGSATAHDLTLEVDDEAQALFAGISDPGERLIALEAVVGPRLFHRILLVRADAPPARVENLYDRLHFHFAGTREVVDTEAGGIGVKYAIGDDTFVIADHPSVVAVMDRLHDAVPREVSFAPLGRLTGLEPFELAPVLKALIGQGLVQVHASRQPFVVKAGERPLASPMARLMFKSETRGPDLRAYTVLLEREESRVCLGLCDGTLNRAELAAETSRILGRDFPEALVEIALTGFASSRLLMA